VNDLVFQGIAARTGKIIRDGDDYLYLKPDCFAKSLSDGDDVGLWIDHDERQSLTRRNKLELYATKSALAFRWAAPNSWKFDTELSVFADDFDTYLPISIGFVKTKIQKVTLDGGITVTVVEEAKLDEVSILSSPPAEHSTFGRIVTLDTCDELKDDMERFELHGAYIGVHRAFKASENNGQVKYSHATSSYDRAADRFERALKNLE
jgi:phage head maturation protease